MRPLNLKIAAGATEAIPIMGRYVRNGDSSPTITVKDEASGDYAILAAGDAVQFDRTYSRLLISHDEATEQTVTINFGFGQILTARTVGTVAVDGIVETNAQNRSALGGQYMAGLKLDAVASNYGLILLNNPSGSGVNAVINRMSMNGSGGTVYVRTYEGHVDGTYTGLGANKIVGGAFSTVRIGFRIDTSIPAASNILAIVSTDSSGTPWSLDMGNSPIILPPNYTLAVHTGVVNTTIVSCYEWEDEPE